MLWQIEVSRFPYGLMNLSCTLSNNTWLISDFYVLVIWGCQDMDLNVSYVVRKVAQRTAEHRVPVRVQGGLPCLCTWLPYAPSFACGVGILLAVWDGL